jgi:hypothetical protein
LKSYARLLREARVHPASFRELYERYVDGVHGFHLRRTRDADAAHDLTAETFAQAWLSRKRFRDEAGGVGGAVAVRDRAARVAGFGATPDTRTVSL